MTDLLRLESFTVCLVPNIVLTITAHSDKGVELEVECCLVYWENCVVWFPVSSEVEVILVFLLRIVEINVLDSTAALDGCDSIAITSWERLNMSSLVFKR